MDIQVCSYGQRTDRMVISLVQPRQFPIAGPAPLPFVNLALSIHQVNNIDMSISD
jgi:hypothetical protein